MIDTKAIRCSILHLAFSGKLTEQNKLDGTARELLSRINAKKNIEWTENTPYEIPDSWSWVRLADLYKINPKVEADITTKAAFIPMERISSGFDCTFTFETQNWEQASRNHTKFSDGDVAFAKITPCFENRKSFIAQGLPNSIGCGTTELVILRQSEMLPEYTYYLLVDQRFINAGISSYKGTVGQQRVQSDVIREYLIPVAPYSEQKRIVEKIEQTFSILDTIDELQTKYANNLSALKSKLIDAAIQGKLTKQLTEDGTAEDLYQQIQAEKQELIKAGKIKKEKPLPPISEDEIPFEIPGNWKWVRLENVTTILGGYAFKSDNYAKDGFRVIRISDFNENGLCNSKIVRHPFTNELSKFLIKKNDILLCMTGGTVGKSYLLNHLDEPMLLNQRVALIRTIFVSPKFINYYILSSLIQGIIAWRKKSTNDNISMDDIIKFPLPLPPLAEQKRIVKRLGEVLAVCDGDFFN